MRRFVLASLLAGAGAVHAGNMSVTIAGLPAPVAITGFSTGAANAGTFPSGGGGGAGKPTFKDFTFKAPQSAATALLLKNLAAGTHLPSARIQVRSADGARLLSEWTLTGVLVAAIDVVNGAPDPKGKAPDFFLPPETAFSLRFSRYCYVVMEGDGTTIATQTCYDLATGTVT
jgi:type VI protein secretion system component Hcp